MSEITVASTTDTQQAIELAAGLNAGNSEQVTGDREIASPEGEQRESFTTEDTEEHRAAAQAAEEEGRSESEDTGEAPAGRAAPSDTRASAVQPKSRTQKQIEALTQRAYEQQEELDALRNQVGGNKGQGTGAQPRAAAVQPDDGRPTPAQYRSHDEFIEALADWKAGQRLQQQRQAEIVQAEQERTREVFETYNEAAKSARAKYADFEEVVGRRDLKIPQAAQVAIIEAGNAGPDIAYYLGKHPEVCQELGGMSPMRAIARIGQIEAEVTHGTPGPSAGYRPQVTGNREQRKAPPAPITPVGGSSSRSSVPLSELPYRDYKRLRDQEERGQR